jgi:trans-aconitate methyltransferase
MRRRPAVSLELIDRAGLGPRARVVDIGAGASRLVDCLLERGYRDITVLDLSAAALAQSRARVGDADGVTWVVADVLTWQPAGPYDLWHDRAAFHFLTEADDRRAYVATLRKALRPGGHAVIGTFAPDGPERCSGLPVMRHDADSLQRELGSGFAVVDALRHEHRTPAGNPQMFQFALFRRT